MERHPRRDEHRGPSPIPILPHGKIRPELPEPADQCRAGVDWAVASVVTQQWRSGRPEGARLVVYPKLVDLARSLHHPRNAARGFERKRGQVISAAYRRLDAGLPVYLRRSRTFVKGTGSSSSA